MESSRPAPDALLVPSLDEWRAMTSAERDAFVDEALATLQREFDLMPSEGAPHQNAKISLRTTLGGHFARVGRKIYLGTELAVLYPEQPPFAPDFLAVADVEDPGDEDTRMAWIVADEGKGPDLVLEVLHAGSRRKDLVDNRLFYGSLGIAEYFVYDRAKFVLHGFRLPAPGATRYVPIVAEAGFLPSRVLGLELAIVGHRLRFAYGGAIVPETRELLDRASAMLDAVEARVDAEAQRAEAEAQRAEAEAALRAEAERRVAELERRIAELLASKP